LPYGPAWHRRALRPTDRLPLEQAIEGIRTVNRGEAVKVTIEA
jgi:deoxyribodipyrimidine photolyase